MKQFPETLYKVVNGQLQTKTIRAGEHAEEEHEAAVRAGWKDTPAGLDAPMPDVPQVGQVAASVDLVAEEAKRAAELHATPEADVVKAIKAVTDSEQLARIGKREKSNPGGPRKKVLEAVKKQIAASL